MFPVDFDSPADRVRMAVTVNGKRGPAFYPKQGIGDN